MTNDLVILQAKERTHEFLSTHIRALVLKHPTKNVSDELCKMALWLERYPKRRPVNIWRFVDNWLNRTPATVAPEPKVNAWWTTDQRTVNQGEALGLKPRPGEEMAEFRQRITERLGQTS